MDDLTRIKGIGKATAGKLLAAGVASFAALAAMQPRALVPELARSIDEAEAWIAAAKALAPQPADQNMNTEAKPPRSEDDPEAHSRGGAGLPADDGAGDPQTDDPRAPKAEGGSGDPAAPAMPLDAPDEAEEAALQAAIGFGKALAGDTGEPAQPEIMVTVIGPAKGRRRAGFLFNALPQTVTVTQGQLDAIRGDAMLAVSIGAPPAGAADPKTGRLTAEAFVRDDGAVMPIRVIGPAKGRRRAGFAFGAAAVTVSPTMEQLRLILDDPSLSVTAAV